MGAEAEGLAASMSSSLTDVEMLEDDTTTKCDDGTDDLARGGEVRVETGADRAVEGLRPAYLSIYPDLLDRNQHNKTIKITGLVIH